MEKKHLALLLPNTDTTLEADLSTLTGWVCHTHRMYLEEVSAEAEKRMVDEGVPEGLHMLQGIIRFDAAIFGCTSASAVYGREGLARLHQRMEAALGCPANSAFGGIKDAIEAAGRPPLALLSPYTPEVNGFFMETLKSFGIETVYQAGLNIVQDPQIAAVEPQRILAFAREHREAVLNSGAKMALFSCTNFRARQIREELEDILGLPVITSNHCLTEWLEHLP